MNREKIRGLLLIAICIIAIYFLGNIFLGNVNKRYQKKKEIIEMVAETIYNMKVKVGKDTLDVVGVNKDLKIMLSNGAVCDEEYMYQNLVNKSDTVTLQQLSKDVKDSQ
ncbi:MULTISPECIES: hypothetical protein [Sphingobacterium]|uniref:hypothetical protein n=1 Tax=Sphingobacterium TaxID=28453 RepID=UPI0013DD6C2B|nr:MULTISPECIES: hypothetical protein [unclassified Sphingobacterium]